MLNRIAATCSIALCVVTTTTIAQDFPARPIRLVVPFPPSGSTDTYARLLAKELAATLGQSVIVDNRPGGTGVIGTQLLRQAAPDGHSLLFTSNTAHVLGPLLRQPRPFDAVTDFMPITMAVRFPLYLVIHPSIPAKSVKEFIAHAKTRQGRLNYSSSGEGGNSHVTALLFNASAGISATHLPYKGAAPAQLAVLSGEAQYQFNNVGTSQPLVASGRLRGLALTGTSRLPAVPDVPTLSELGIKGLENLYVWLGLLGPAGLPASVQAQLSATVTRALKAPDVVERAARDGYEIVASSPAQFTADIRKEVEMLERVIRDNALSVN